MLETRAPITQFKAFDAEEGEAPGTFEAIIAVFDNVDLYGDVVEKGAFAESLAEGWPKLIWSHRWNEPPIGVTLAIEERDQGVYAKGRLFVGEGEDSPLARQVWTAMKAVDGKGAAGVDEFSYAWMPIDYGHEVRDGEDVWAIRKASITEWGPCLKGVNPETELLTVKGLERRKSVMPGYDPARLTATKATTPSTSPGSPEPNSTPDPVVDEEAKARTQKAADLLYPPLPA